MVEKTTKQKQAKKWNNLVSGPCFKVDIDVIKRKIFASCNAVLNNSVYQLDLLRLHLSESYCMPVLQYCLGAITSSNSQLRKLNACWNMVYRTILVFIGGNWSNYSSVALVDSILNIFMYDHR